LDVEDSRGKDNLLAVALPLKNGAHSRELRPAEKKVRRKRTSASSRMNEPGETFDAKREISEMLPPERAGAESRLEWRPQVPPIHPQSVEGTAPACPAPHMFL